MDEQNIWDDAYEKGGNLLFYPHEEIVRFINAYIRKREGVDHYSDIMHFGDTIASLDLGCGIGRHVKLLDEFGLNPYGIDVSKTAIDIGKQWFQEINKPYICEKLFVSNATKLPFHDSFFDVCVSHSTLDCMSIDSRYNAFEEIKRVLKPGGIMYFDMDMGIGDSGNKEEVRKDIWYSRETTRNYSSKEDIYNLIANTFVVLQMKTIINLDESDRIVDRRLHVIIKKAKK